jgi:transcriptional regulator with XRE-family HTH domain
MRVSEYDTRISSFPKLQDCNKGGASYASGMGLEGFGERLRKARKAAKIKGDDLGEKVGVSKSTISHWEHDRYEPSLEQLVALCSQLRVSADWLIGREQPELSAEALHEAKAFEDLRPEDKRKWRALRMTIFSEA